MGKDELFHAAMVLAILSGVIVAAAVIAVAFSFDSNRVPL